MKKISTGLVLLLALGLVSCGSGASVNYRDQREQREFTGVTSLTIRQDGLDIELMPGFSDTLSVSVRIDEMTVKGLDPADIDNLESPFEFSHKDGKLTIRPAYGEKVKNSSGLIVVKLPRSVMDIEVETGRGDIRAQGLTVRNLDLVSRRGSVTNASCTGTENMHIGSALPPEKSGN